MFNYLSYTHANPHYPTLFSSRQKSIDCSIVQFEELKNHAEVDEEKATEELKFLNGVLNESMEMLHTTSENIVDRLSRPQLMCQSKFDCFLSMEEEYTALLTKLANSQFDEVLLNLNFI